MTWWEPRRPDEPVTANYLGRVLDELGAYELARKARAAHYDDFYAPTEVADGMEIIRLVKDLKDWSRNVSRDQRMKARAVIEAVKAGEFDATREEADRWAASAEGLRAMSDEVGLAQAAALLALAKNENIVALAREAADRITGTGDDGDEAA